jgi:hypothetical protein
MLANIILLLLKALILTFSQWEKELIPLAIWERG